MRSSFYRTVRRFSSRASSARSFNERPFSAVSRISENPVNNTLPGPLKQKRSEMTSIAPAQPPTTHRTADATDALPPRPVNTRRNSSNQIQPVSAISYQNSSKNQPKSTKTPAVVSTREDDDPTVTIETRRS